MAACCTGYINAVVGARRAFATGALIFGLGALVCALASTMAHVIIGRFVQGFGGGLLAAMAYVLVRSTFPEMIWTRAITLLSGAWSMSILFGPLLGGAFATYGNWRGALCRDRARLRAGSGGGAGPAAHAHGHMASGRACRG